MMFVATGIIMITTSHTDTHTCDSGSCSPFFPFSFIFTKIYIYIFFFVALFVCHVCWFAASFELRAAFHSFAFHSCRCRCRCRCRCLPPVLAILSCNKICQNLSRLSAISSSSRHTPHTHTVHTHCRGQQQYAHTKWAQRQRHHHAHYAMIINLQTSFWAFALRGL